MNNEEWYVILNMNCKYEICRMCPKSGLFKGSYEECEKWIEQKQKEEMKDELHTWKEASENNSYKAFQLQEENKTLAQHILELQNDKGELVDKCRELEAQIEKMKRYIKACWVEENLNDYSSYITNTSDEFRDLVKELNEEIRNGR